MKKSLWVLLAAGAFLCAALIFGTTANAAVQEDRVEFFASSVTATYNALLEEHGEAFTGSTFYQLLTDVQNYIADKDVNDDGDVIVDGTPREIWVYIKERIVRTNTNTSTSWTGGKARFTAQNGKAPLIHITSFDTSSAANYAIIRNTTTGAYLCNVDHDFYFEKIKIENLNSTSGSSARQAQFQMGTSERLTFGEGMTFTLKDGNGTAGNGVIWCGGQNAAGVTEKELTVLSGTWSSINFMTGYNYAALDTKVTVGGNAVVTDLVGCQPEPASTTTVRASSTLTNSADVTICGNARVTTFKGALGTLAKAYFDTITVTGDLSVTVKDNAEITTFYGATCRGTMKGKVTNTVSGGTITDFYGAGLSGTVEGKVKNVVSGGTITNFYGGQAADTQILSAYQTALVKGGIENVFEAGCTVEETTYGASKGISGNDNMKVECAVTTTVNGGRFGYSIYGAGFRVPVKGNVSLTIYGEPSYGPGAKNNNTNRTAICYNQKDGNARVCGGSGQGEANTAGANTSLEGYYGYIDGDVTLYIDGGYIFATVFASGVADVNGSVTATVKNVSLNSKGCDVGGVSSGGDVWGNGSMTFINSSCSRLGAMGFRTTIHGDSSVKVSGGSMTSIATVSTQGGVTYSVTGTATLEIDLTEYDLTLPSNVSADYIISLKGGEKTLTIPKFPFTVAGTITGTPRIASTVSAPIGEICVQLPESADENTVVFTPSSGGVTFDPDLHAIVGYFKPAGNSIRLGDDFALRYYFDKAAVDDWGGDFKVYLSRDGVNYEETPVSVLSISENLRVSHYYTVLAEGISPKNAGDTVYLKTSVSDGVDRYSVAEACRTVIAGDFSESFQTLAKALLNYAASAQTYFGHDTAHLVVTEPYDVAAQDYSDNADKGDRTGKAVRIRGTSVLTRDAVALKFYVEIDPSVDPASLTPTVNGAPAGELTVNGAYYTFIYSVPAAQLREDAAAVILQGETPVSNVYVDSVASYCAYVRDRSSDDALKDLAARLMAYVDAARAYLGELNQAAGDIELFISDAESEAENARGAFDGFDTEVYYVGATRENTSLITLLLDLSGNETPKTIYIDEGEYDLFAEYLAEVWSDGNPGGRLVIPKDEITSGTYMRADEGDTAKSFVPDGVDPTGKWYNAFVPNNTKVVGLGEVTLRFTPGADEITYGASRTWSALNVLGTVMLENLNIVGKNCRYTLHNDDHNAYHGEVQYYKNVRFEYQLCDYNSANKLLGFNNTVGFGISENGVHLFENCEIFFNGAGDHSAYYGHNPSGAGGKEGLIVLKDCHIYASDETNARVIRPQTLSHATPGRFRLFIDGCDVNGGILFNMYYSDSVQNFDTVFRNTARMPVSYTIASGGVLNNPYPVRYAD